MPRYPRITAPEVFYHIMNRGIEKKAIFRNDKDYFRFLNLLAKYSKEFDWKIYCYCFLPNHFHLLVQTQKHPLSLIMKSLQTAYGVYFNKKYNRVGPVFAGRFKSIICQEDEYFLQVSKYIHLNPVRLGLCEDPADYPYSSYKNYIRETGDRASSIIDKRSMKRILGDNISDKSRRMYRLFVEESEDIFDYNPEKSQLTVFGNDRFATKLNKIKP